MHVDRECPTWFSTPYTATRSPPAAYTACNASSRPMRFIGSEMRPFWSGKWGMTAIRCSSGLAANARAKQATTSDDQKYWSSR